MKQDQNIKPPNGLVNVSRQVRDTQLDHTSDLEQDLVIDEQAIAFVYNGISHAVMMATPCDLKDFALGFSLSENIIDQKNDLLDLEITHTAHGIELNITISSRKFIQLKEKRRTLAGNSGCGLCGIESLQQIDKNRTPLNAYQTLASEVIEAALTQFKTQQVLNLQAGGVHAAAFCDLRTGDIRIIREDVGRHNALDKLIGAINNHKLKNSNGFILVSSRASYEMVDKTIAANINHLITISAPTSKAIAVAKQNRLNLISFARSGRFVIYA